MTESSGRPDEPVEALDDADGSVQGERGIASVNRVRTVQSRVTTVLAASLMGVLGLGLLSWYYKGAFTRSANAHEAAEKALTRRVQGEMPLPPLGHLEPPQSVLSDDRMLAHVVGPKPELPADFGSARPVRYAGGTRSKSTSTTGQTVLDRQLKGAVFAGADHTSGARGTGASDYPSNDAMLDVRADSQSGSAGKGQAGEFGSMLTSSVTPAVRARVLPTQRLLIPKGAFLDCTLETAIDSSLPGMTTCVTATDTYGVDGTVVLLERGTKLVGETRGEVRQGASRLFVLWTEARTPTGVVIPLASPGTNELGRSGMFGQVERHFWARFGAAMLVSVIDGAVQAVSRPSGGSGSVVYSTTGTRDLMTEILRETMRVAPTLSKPQGDRIQVLVARDLDFRSVYELTLSGRPE